jgi:hypothetical protein
MKFLSAKSKVYITIVFFALETLPQTILQKIASRRNIIFFFHHKVYVTLTDLE